MTGDVSDFAFRLRSVLPPGWFPDETPVLDQVLRGLAWCWSWLFEGIAYVRGQARISTASDVWLDTIALDYFGPANCQRRARNDDEYRRAILAELLRERATRRGLHTALEDLTGRTPLIFEPANPADTGGYGSLQATISGFAYGAAGGWGSLALPFQAFVTAFRPTDAGISTVIGYGGAGGSYGGGRIEYASLGMIVGRVTDDDINSTIAAITPAATICWTRISS